MDRTRILLPLALEDEQRDPEKFKTVRELLAQLEQKDVSMRGATFKEFLKQLNMSYEEYVLALRSGINRPTVVLKRTVDEVLINSYNPKILSLMQANMDIQFVLDEYAVVAYLVDYVNKPGRGLSKILRNCIEATAQGKHSLKECLVSVANQFINSAEISAQEAAWSILELPMKYLKQLDSNSRDVYELNIIDRYVVRPNQLENVCLANFAAWYELAKVGSEDRKLLKGNQYVRRRTKPKVIQYRKFKESQDENEYYREQVMLFTSWRNENADILNLDFKQLYTTNLETIRMNRKEFVADENLDLEEELMQLEKSRELEENEEKSEETSLVSFEPVLEYDENEIIGNISLDMNASHGKGFSVFQPTNKCPDDKYREWFKNAT
ncbi:ATP-dependent DNA helicase [Trichonephila clavata]|uniref:ATP-dependent DNA helicase n=1 Tax=Trichonephila clavata TaxID=2740835 RepID=A0A8X6LEY2_TRICU|nr:ATP-dependent DNA helicase [Trichonephila clavata]